MSTDAQRFDEFAQLNREWSLGGHNTPEQFTQQARALEERRTLGVFAVACLEHGENSRDPDHAMAAVRFSARAAQQRAHQRAHQLQQQQAVERVAERLGADPVTGEPLHPQSARQRLTARLRQRPTRQGIER